MNLKGLKNQIEQFVADAHLDKAIQRLLAVVVEVYDQLQWLYEAAYRDRYATANSIYSLGARLDELVRVRRWMTA